MDWLHPRSHARKLKMKQDLLVVTIGMLAVGTLTWVFWGNPIDVSHSDHRARLVQQSNPTINLRRTTDAPSVRQVLYE